MSWNIYLSPPHTGSAELEYVKEAFASNWIAPLGPHVDGFEKELCAFTGARHAAALSSGTAALHLALVMLEVGAGDEVICQSFTFCGSANPIVYLGATPVFVDSEGESWNIDPEALETAIKDRIRKRKKPKAIIYVHLYGMPAQYDEIRKIAGKYEIALIEDAAEALGSEYKGKKCGSLGEISILSFNGNKIITTSGGGALLSDNEAYISRARFLATQARDPAPHYEHSTVGYNYRMSNVCAGIGRGQLQTLQEKVASRRRNFTFYKNRFREIPEISFPEEPDYARSNRWLTCMLVDSRRADREKIRLTLAEKKIESRPLWKPLHMQPVFKEAPFYGSGVAENLFSAGLCLPSGSGLQDEELELIAETVKSLFS